MAQQSLFNIAPHESDIVYTPEWVVVDMISYFKPCGKILEPCAGDGAFIKHLPPETEWCEIERGRDFYAYSNRIDWIVGNPPYKQILEWLKYSFSLADNIVYLIPMNSPFNSMKRMNIILEWGGIKSIRAYGNGSIFGMNYGFAVGAFHFLAKYCGDTNISIAKMPNKPFQGMQKDAPLN
ncbi:MAG: hypothetical protein H8D56_22255 [Planctomycetes bacterium]|nr:hypothetical protein [Planctomycetota bacterium]